MRSRAFTRVYALVALAFALVALAAVEQPDWLGADLSQAISAASLLATIVLCLSLAETMWGAPIAQVRRVSVLTLAFTVATLVLYRAAPWVVVGGAKVSLSVCVVGVGVEFARGEANARKQKHRMGLLLGAGAAHAFMVAWFLVWDYATSDVTLKLAVLTVFSAIASGAAFLMTRDLGIGGPGATPPTAPSLDGERPRLKDRRVDVGVHPALPPLGLALSGGGIRSATLSLGFLRGLAEARLLHRVDLLSTVSGGGWAGGAVVAEAARQHARGRSLDESDFWNQLVARIRARRAFLFSEGGASLGDIVQLMLRVMTGAIANSLVTVCVVISFGILIPEMAAPPESRCAPGVMFLVENAPRSLHEHYPFHALRHPELQALNLVTVCAAWLIVGSLVCLALSALSYLRGIPKAVPEVLVQAGTSIGILALWFSLAHLMLKGSPWVTGIALTAVIGVVVARLIRRMSWEAFATAGLGLLTGTELIHPLELAVTKMTDLWSGALCALLLAPSGVPERVYSLLGQTPVHGAGVSAPHMIFAAALLILALGLMLFIDRNHTSLHAFWSTRIARAFLRHDEPHPIEMKFLDRSTCIPYHIVNCAVNVPGSDDPTLRSRTTDHFEFTPSLVGSKVTGQAPCSAYGDGVTYEDTIGISAAAVSSQGGAAIPTVARFPITALNLSLGFWLRNPRYAHEKGAFSRFRSFARLWELHSILTSLGRNSEEDSMVLVSDGGHHDNLGLLSLVLREVPIIVCVDAAADPAYGFADLGRTLHLLRDHGWESTDLEIDTMKPKGASTAWTDRVVDRPVRTFKLSKNGEGRSLTVIYVKAAVTSRCPFDVRAYAETEPCFPQQTTVDQVFDGWQFDAYFSIGRHLAELAVEPLKAELTAGTNVARAAEDRESSG